MTIWTTSMTSPVGELRLFAGDRGLRSLLWPRNDIEQVGLVESPVEDRKQEFLRTAVRQIKEYFFDGRRDFDVPLDPIGTEFQLLAWEALRRIPYGETRSYGEQARSIGRPHASRAIGGANNKNPISLIIPCHRVIGANGKLVGFGGGLDVKRFLLDHEADGLF